ncbi:MAG TPA: class I SAM-dependent methyltransferase [bacterium]|jgi:SAM-dependent methyltransferase
MMDEYTLKTKRWLDNRFRETDKNGIYFAHQPIYGFRKGHCEFAMVSRYMRTYHIMRAISRLNVKSLLDVGAAEGYKAAVARELFGIQVTCTDLSEEACNRAREIYNIEAAPADVHELPYGDNAFDVSLCSETLEHVTDFRKAMQELLRVSKKAVIVTVPHEPEAKVEANIASAAPHGHIHAFEPNSFDYLKEAGLTIYNWRIESSKLSAPAVLIDAMPVQYQERWKFPKWVASAYNLTVPILRLFLGKRTAAWLIRKDESLCKTSPSYTGLVLLILKDPTAFKGESVPEIDPLRIINFAVPYHTLRK